MSSAALRKLRLPLIIAAVLALVAAGRASAAYLVIDGMNTGTKTTLLKGSYNGFLFSGANSNTGAQAVGVAGGHTASAGTGAGVYGTTASSSAGASGVFGYESNAAAAPGSAGVIGRTSSTAAGTDAGGGAYGVLGIVGPSSPGYWSAGVRGINDSTTGAGLGVWGSVNGAGWGVYGRSKTGIGVTGMSQNPCAGSSSDPRVNAGVLGFTPSYTNSGVLGTCKYGVFGQTTVAYGAGVRGEARGTPSDGVEGISYNSDSYGVYGKAVAGFAGYFDGKVETNGNVTVNGHLSVTGGCAGCGPGPQLRSSAPSVPNGNAVTDGRGYAVVHLPTSFRASPDLRYQLTPIGQFAQAIVWKKVSGHTFTIRTDKPRVEVSWQVTRPS